MPHKPDHYHQTNPPCELKSVVLGRKGSKKGQKQSDSPTVKRRSSSACSPCDPHATSKKWDKMLWDMRMSESHHLGGGDIRITLAQQADIVAAMERLEMENDSVLPPEGLAATTCSHS